jgi:signal recognition particle subunit SRP54
MTPLERRKPELINGSRRTRIATGSGTTVADVNRLVKQFEEMRKMMKRMGPMMGGKGLKGAAKAAAKAAKKGKRPPGGFPGKASPGQVPGNMFPDAFSDFPGLPPSR